MQRRSEVCFSPALGILCAWVVVAGMVGSQMHIVVVGRGFYRHSSS